MLKGPLETFRPVIESVPLKKKENRAQPRVEPGPLAFYTFLPYHYTTTPTRQNSKIPKNLSRDTSKLSFLNCYIRTFFSKKKYIPGCQLEKQSETMQSGSYNKVSLPGGTPLPTLPWSAPSWLRKILNLTLLFFLVGISLASVVQMLHSAIHRINRYPKNKYHENQLRYPLCTDLSSRKGYPPSEQLGP